VDDKGLSGLEAALDSELGGQPGWVLAERDTGGDEIALAERQAQEPVDGADVTLTLDRFVQHVVERELAAAVEAHHAKSGSAVVLDPHTGAVMALASYPSLRFDDPNLFDASRMPLYRIPPADDLYEPGSVFKVVTYAAGLDSGVITPETAYMETNALTYGKGTVRNAVEWPVGMVSMTLALQRSSNVGAAYVGTKVGPQRFYEYVAAFGFGQPTGVGLPGEAAGLVKRPGQSGWGDYDLAANSFGQGIAVTPLQMASAVAAVANGGTLLRPYVVAEVSGPSGRTSTRPAIARQVVRGDTAKRLSDMLVSVVDFADGGKPRLSRVPGYRVAGKSGTAEVPRGQGYDQTATVASFVGYAPADDPRFVLLVTIYEPQDSPWGETVAAPVFRAIAQDLLVYFRVPPDQSRLSELGPGAASPQ
jgi:cell division protein FtsI/penicillin-binding protein 2